MTAQEQSGLTWLTASNATQSCVEVAHLEDGDVAVRDSKDHGSGPVLRYTAAEWDAFVTGIASGVFDRR